VTKVYIPTENYDRFQQVKKPGRKGIKGVGI